MKKCLLLFYLRRLKGLNTPARVIEFACQRYKDRTFLVRASDNASCTFGEIFERAKKMAASLKEQGVRAQDVVAFSAPNCFEYYEIRIACHLAGFLFLGLPPGLGEEEIRYFLELSGARVFFRSGKLEVIEAPSKRHSSLVNTATLNLSSATTSKVPKVLRLSEKNWIESLYLYVANSDVPIKKSQVFLPLTPLVTAGSTSLLPALLAGITTVVTDESSDVHAVAALMQKYRVNRLYITPSRLIELLQWSRDNNARFPALENIVTGTERFPLVWLKEAIDFFGPIITVGYGMVEALPPIALHSPRGAAKLESAGKIVKGVMVKVDKEGRIAVKSKTVSAGYLNNPEETARCFRGGWFYSSDYGYTDQQGYVYLRGRQEEILSHTPRKIFAKEIEDNVYNLTYVNRCAALAKGGNVVVFLSLRAGITNTDVVKEVSDLVTATGIPAQKVSVVVKDRLPISPLGKLDRRKLTEEIS